MGTWGRGIMGILGYINLLVILLLPVCGFSKTIQFSIATEDGITQIHGQVDLPDEPASRSVRKFPIVLMVGGTGLFDRDYNYGSSNTDRDLLFKEFSLFLNKHGIAAARYDYRGVSCSERTVPLCKTCNDEKSITQHYVNSCIDNKIRATVTATNPGDDAASVYKYLMNQPTIDAAQIIIFAHSEGTIHLSRLISKSLIKPKGLLMMGFVAESPRALFQWQFTSRMADAYWEMDLNSDKKIENNEISTVCKTNAMPQDQCESLKSSTGSWTESSLQKEIIRKYQATRDEVFTHSDSEPFKYLLGEYGVIWANYNWWKLFFTDGPNNLNGFFNFNGKISFNNGEIDGATPAQREFNLLSQTSFNSPIHINSYPNRGHSLGTKHYGGPIEDDSLNKLMNEIHWLLQ